MKQTGQMRPRRRLLKRLMIAALIATPITLGACGSGGNRVYDPYYGDYHRWNHAEDLQYRQWENETHRPHIGFDRRPAEEQRVYFGWRHGQR